MLQYQRFYSVSTRGKTFQKRSKQNLTVCDVPCSFKQRMIDCLSTLTTAYAVLAYKPTSTISAISLFSLSTIHHHHHIVVSPLQQ